MPHTLAEGRARWSDLQAHAAAHGVTYAQLCRLVAETKGPHQIVEQLSDEQLAWVGRQCERLARERGA